jgi:DNA-binding IclR family transcriptional regulator
MSEDEGSAKRTGTQVFTRADALLAELEKSSEPMTLTALSRATGLSASTAHRILGALAGMGLVDQDESGTWGLGLRLIGLGRLVYERNTMRRRALEAMLKLHRTTGASVLLAIRRGDRAVIIESIAAEGFARVPNAPAPGSSEFLHRCACGMLFLSELSPDELRGYAGRTGIDKEPLDAIDRLLIELTRIRENGWARTEATGPFASALAVSAPVRGPGGRLAAALSLSAPMPQDIPPGFIAELCDAARRVSSEAGAPSPFEKSLRIR